MKISIFGIFVNLIYAVVLGQLRKENVLQRYSYNVLAPHTVDPFVNLDEPESRNLKVLMNDGEHVWSNIMLTTAEAASLQHNLNASNVTVETDGVAFNVKSEKKDHKKASEKSIYLNGVAQCDATISNKVEIFVMDTYIDPTKPAFKDTFKGVTVAHATTSIPAYQCNPHGSYVSSIIFGNGYGVIRHGTRNIYNIPVFTCGGAANLSAVYTGLNAAVARAKENTANGIRSILNWSISGGGANTQLDTAVAAAVKAGILFGVSAGNTNNNICQANASPWRVPGIYIIGGTTQPGDTLAYFSNYGECVIMYYGSTFKMVNGKADDGTSFSIPNFIAAVALEADKTQTATNQQLVDKVLNRTTVVHTVLAPYAGQNIRVMTKAASCPAP